MIIAVDFDGTLQLPNGEPNRPLIARLKAEQARGGAVILWSCRSGDRLREAVAFCMKHGLRPNAVNANVPAAIKMLGHDPRKIFADVYIDDKAVKV